MYKHQEVGYNYSSLVVGVWCSSNTLDFDSSILGAIPSTPAKKSCTTGKEYGIITLRSLTIWILLEAWQSPVYCTCLENRRTEMFREFESHRFRHIKAHGVSLCDKH